MKAAKIYDGTDPGATLGRAFVASIGQETVIPEGKVLNFIKLGMQGAISTAAVAIETFAGLLSEYNLRVGAESRITANMQELVALMGFYYGEIPAIGENTDNTGFDFIGGVKIPVYAAAEVAKPITHTAEWTTATNVATSTLSATGYWDDTPNGHKPIHAVKIAHTTAGSAGYETLSFRVAPIGQLIGLILKNTNGLNDGNIDASIQRVRILVDGQLHSQFNALGDMTPPSIVDYVTPLPLADILKLYTVCDLRPTGLDAKGKEVTLQLDVEDVSDAITILPVLELVG